MASDVETHSVQKHLSVSPEEYDREIRRFIPLYDEMIATGVRLLGELSGAAPHVLDLGAGTGALSFAVLSGLPNAKVTLLDVDTSMLAKAKQRLAQFANRMNVLEKSFLQPLPKADAVVASLALHHIHDLPLKTKVYQAIYDALPVGGVFLNLDAAVSEDPKISQLVNADWTKHMGNHGITPDEAQDHFRQWAKEDRYFPLHAEMAALRQAGFGHVECFWRRGPLAITGGIR